MWWDEDKLFMIRRGSFHASHITVYNGHRFEWFSEDIVNKSDDNIRHATWLWGTYFEWMDWLETIFDGTDFHYTEDELTIFVNA